MVKKRLVDYELEVGRVAESYLNQNRSRIRDKASLHKTLLDYLGGSEIKDKESIEAVENKVIIELGMEVIKKKARKEGDRQLLTAINVRELTVPAKVKGRVVYARKETVLHKKLEIQSKRKGKIIQIKKKAATSQVIYRNRKGQFSSIKKVQRK